MARRKRGTKKPKGFKDKGLLMGTKGQKVDFANTKPSTFPDDRHNDKVKKF